MSNVFRLLTSGVNFNTSKFREESRKFGLIPPSRDEKEIKEECYFPAGETPLETPPETPPESRNPSSEEEDDESDDEVQLFTDSKSSKKKKQEKKKKGGKLSASARASELKRLHREEKLNRFRNVHRIHVSGSDIPPPLDNSWSKLKERFAVPDNLIEAISAHYPKGPTPIQMQVIPAIMERREILATAETGSGKTASYLLPLIHLLREPRPHHGGCRALILAPTRELAHQIQRETLKFAACRGIKSAVIREKKPAKADILITTPNRLVYLINKGEINLNHAEYLIVDESDKLFEAGEKGFREQLATVYKACTKANICRGFFSATLAPEVEQWCRLNLDNPVSVTIGARNSACTAVEQELIYTGSEKGKKFALENIINKGMKPPVLIFVQTKDRADELLKELTRLKLKADAIHAQRSQLQRDKAVQEFRSGRIWVLVCTELMGRGIDFKGVNIVINYDFPPSTVSYIHRIGRTGRAGRAGKAVTFFTDTDKVLLRSIASIVKASGSQVPEYMLTLKKASRQQKRALVKSAPKRDPINNKTKKKKKDKKENKSVKKEEVKTGVKRKRKSSEVDDEKPTSKKSKKNDVKKSKKRKREIDD